MNNFKDRKPNFICKISEKDENAYKTRVHTRPNRNEMIWHQVLICFSGRVKSCSTFDLDHANRLALVMLMAEKKFLYQWSKMSKAKSKNVEK